MIISKKSVLWGALTLSGIFLFFQLLVWSSIHTKSTKQTNGITILFNGTTPITPLDIVNSTLNATTTTHRIPQRLLDCENLTEPTFQLGQRQSHRNNHNNILQQQSEQLQHNRTIGFDLRNNNTTSPFNNNSTDFHKNSTQINNSTQIKNNSNNITSLSNEIPNNSTIPIRPMPKSVLVTGAAGFIGFHLAMKLHSNGDFVVGMDNFSTSRMSKIHRARQLQSEGISFIKSDMGSSPALRDILRKFNITHVAHMVTEAESRTDISQIDDIDTSDSKYFLLLLNAVRFINLERQLLRKQTSTKNETSIPATNDGNSSGGDIAVVWASSSSVYGLDRKCSLCLAEPADVMDAQTKKANEMIAFSFHSFHGVHLTGLRFFSIYGPWGRPDSIIHELMMKIIRNETISISAFGDCSVIGEQVLVRSQDLTYIDDAVNGIVASLELDAPFEIFNIASGQTYDITDIVDQLEQHLGQTTSRLFDNNTLFDSRAPMVYANIQHAKEMLGYEPIISLTTGIRDFVDWYLKYEYPQDFIMTTYFTGLTDPQHITIGPSRKNNFLLMKNWYESVNRLGLHAIIFHDELSDEFIEQYETPKIRFLKVTWPKSHLSTNDQRFLFWRDFLQSRMHAANGNPLLEPRYVLTTDLFDVRFGKNPFEFMRESQEHLFLSTEYTTIGNNSWMRVKMKQCGYDWQEFENHTIINAGVMGGEAQPYLDLLTLITEEFSEAPRNGSRNCNMPAVNFVVLSNVPDQFVTGQPFHSVFKSFTKGDKYCVYHKR